MNYLLDTHAFLWAIFDSKKLTTQTKEIILDPTNFIYVSLITFWEISLKYALGKIDLNNVLPESLPGVSKEAGFDILDLTEEEVSSFYQLPKFHHKDPFDRLIIWQAIKNDLILISKDTTFSDYKETGLQVTW